MKNLLIHLTIWLTIISSLGSCCPGQETIQAPLFDNLGEHHLTVSTTSPMAQRFFDQGLNLTYGFNHAEAARSFREAIRLDSTCAMAYWGAAFVLGPNYNAAMGEDVRQSAVDYVRQAVAYRSKAAPWEQALINALATRYDYERTDDQDTLNKVYADAMAQVHQQYPQRDDIQVLYAEALMNLHPWDLYTRAGVAKPWTPKIVATLEEVLAHNPKHPGANHLYIHVVEASDQPEQGLASAHRLGGLMPGSGHLVHMPSHIYIRTGHYHEGSVVNERAIAVDSVYIDQCNAQGVYPLTYFPHNIHFLAATAALEGRGETAINAAYRVAAHTATDLMREPGMETLQHYWIIPYYVMVKFGQWDQLLTIDPPAADLIYPLAIWHYARGMAQVGKGYMSDARASLKQLEAIQQDTALAHITIWELNSVDQLVSIAARMLEAEISRQGGDLMAAIALLEEAVVIEDQLNYNEPPDWFFSVRHALGAVLLEAKQYERAETIYREDLRFYPRNGWALNGLYHSLTGQNRLAEAIPVKQQFKQAWRYADITLSTSEVKPLAYQRIVPSPVIDRPLAELAAVTWCGTK